MPEAKYVISRESLANDEFRHLWASGNPDTHILDESELEASRRETLARRPDKGDLLIFAYGSLLWNPAIDHTHSMPATAFGYHRRYSLWTVLGRGCRECPGLMLGLDRGGSCRGTVLSVEADKVEHELSILWRREMVTAAYRPHWLHVEVEGERKRALAFVIARDGARYASNMSIEEVAKIIASAEGPLGSCYDYLKETRMALKQLDIYDNYLERIERAINAVQP